MDTFSSFPFENFLGKLKKIIRSGNNPTQQLLNRYHELLTFKKDFVNEVKKNARVEVRHPMKSTEIADVTMKRYKWLILGDVTFKINEKKNADMFCIINDKVIMIIEEILKNETSGKCFVRGRTFRKKSEVFPSSDAFGVYKVDELNAEKLTFEVNESNIRKCYAIPASLSKRGRIESEAYLTQASYIVMKLIHNF